MERGSNPPGRVDLELPGLGRHRVERGAVQRGRLAKNGLTTYAQHPLLRCVSIDRSFYRPMTEGQYARYAGQVPDDFRFVVKASALVTNALVRGEQGQGCQPNTAFLDPALATQEFITPALAGLGDKEGRGCCSWRPCSIEPAPRIAWACTPRCPLCPSSWHCCATWSARALADGHREPDSGAVIRAEAFQRMGGGEPAVVRSRRRPPQSSSYLSL
jgi:Protein of unknown function DUF72